MLGSDAPPWVALSHPAPWTAAQSRERCLGYLHLHSLLNQLLDYVMTTLLFSDKNVDSNLITWNRVVLLHGETRQVA